MGQVKASDERMFYQHWLKEREWVRRYSALHPCFTRRQKYAELQGAQRTGHYLGVRLDGIDMSRRFLKNGLFHERFDKCLHKAVLQLLANYCRNMQGNLLVLCCSDEVSLIEQTPGALGEDNLYKICTVLASLLTYYFNLNANRMPWRRLGYQGGFDARPIHLYSNLEVSNYIGYRLALYQQNMLTKLLRLKKVPTNEIYQPPFFNHIDYLFAKSADIQDHRELKRYIQQPALTCWPNQGHVWYHLQQFADFASQIQARGIFPNL